MSFTEAISQIRHKSLSAAIEITACELVFIDWPCACKYEASVPYNKWKNARIARKNVKYFSPLFTKVML